MNNYRPIIYASCIAAGLLFVSVLISYALSLQWKGPIPLPPTPQANGGNRVLPTWTPDKPGATPVPGLLYRPNSARVQQGQAYEFTLYTHCGLDRSVDFDGSFWDVSASPKTGSGGNARPRFDNPHQKGVMTLLDASHARFEYFYEGFRAIDFVRHVGPKHIMVCL